MYTDRQGGPSRPLLARKTDRQPSRSSFPPREHQATQFDPVRTGLRWFFHGEASLPVQAATGTLTMNRQPESVSRRLVTTWRGSPDRRRAL